MIRGPERSHCERAQVHETMSATTSLLPYSGPVVASEVLAGMGVLYCDTRPSLLIVRSHEPGRGAFVPA
jgi:hypothetical protein